MDKPPFVISDATGKLIKEWCESGEAVPPPITALEAVQKLQHCNTIEELKTLKEILPLSVRQDQTFTEAANERFYIITGKK